MYDIYEDSESDDVGSPNQCIVCIFEKQSLESRNPISSILDKEFQGNIKPNVVVSVGYFRDQGGNFQFSSLSSPTIPKNKFDVIIQEVISHKQEDVVVTCSRFASSNNFYDPVASYMEAKQSDKSCILHLLCT